MSINFNSQVLLTQQLIKQKKLNRNSSLIYISSIASKIGVAGTAIYAASKSALNAFVRVTATELSTQNIRVNSICPGIILTPMGEKAQSMSENVSKDYPLGLGTPKDIVGPCIFLLTEASRWVTGTEMILDGGLTLI
jgi:NAD(P)-dependent dehydrogenase (short-subunit alcohol dehydrogenase family)